MKNICFITLSRSDYSTMRPIINSALNDPHIDVKVIVGGSHLLNRFGYTIENIEKDNIPIHAVVDFLLETDDTDGDLALAYCRAFQKFVQILEDCKPNYIFIVGDRWEMLSVAMAASILRIPIFHHSGGDITQGSADNQTRYILTTLSHIHFVALDEHRRRLLKMGEEPWRVITTGEPALTEILSYSMSIADIYSALGLQKDKKFVLATFHPTSYDFLSVEKQIQIFIEALKAIEHQIILTAPNPDSGSGYFYKLLKQFAKAQENVQLIENLGSERYYAAMSKAEFMIGNSSSGIWEAPSFRLPVVNIGERQRDRVYENNVIHVPLDLKRIKIAIQDVQSLSFKNKIADCQNPYMKNDTLALILSNLKKNYTSEELLAKKYIDPLKVS